MIVGVLIMVLVTFIWGAGFLIAYFVDLPSPVYVFFRFVFALPFVLLLGYRYGFKKPNWMVVSTGFFMAANWIFLFWAIKYIDISSADLIYYSGPVIAVALSPLVLRTGNPWWAWLAVGTAFGGISLMYTTSGTLNVVGVLLALAGGVFYAFLILFGKILSSSYHPAVVVSYQMIIGGLVTLPFGLFMDYRLDWFKLVLLMIAGVVVSALSLFMWLVAMRRLSVRLISVLAYLDPFFATLLATVFLKQEVSLGTILGGIMIVGAGVFSVYMEQLEREGRA